MTNSFDAIKSNKAAMELSADVDSVGSRLCNYERQLS